MKRLNCRKLLAKKPKISYTTIKIEPWRSEKGDKMSKYNALWEYVRRQGQPTLKLTFEKIQNVSGIPLDHSFLKYKNELEVYGYHVGKISMKEKTVIFEKLDE